MKMGQRLSTSVLPLTLKCHVSSCLLVSTCDKSWDFAKCLKPCRIDWPNSSKMSPGKSLVWRTLITSKVYYPYTLFVSHQARNSHGCPNRRHFSWKKPCGHLCKKLKNPTHTNQKKNQLRCTNANERISSVGIILILCRFPDNWGQKNRRHCQMHPPFIYLWYLCIYYIWYIEKISVQTGKW